MSLCNLAGVSAAMLPRRLPNSKAIEKLSPQVARLKKTRVTKSFFYMYYGDLWDIETGPWISGNFPTIIDCSRVLPSRFAYRIWDMWLVSRLLRLAGLIIHGKIQHYRFIIYGANYIVLRLMLALSGEGNRPPLGLRKENMKASIPINMIRVCKYHICAGTPTFPHRLHTWIHAHGIQPFSIIPVTWPDRNANIEGAVTLMTHWEVARGPFTNMGYL